MEVLQLWLRPLTSYCYLPVENLLTRPHASSETTDSFFLGFSSKYKHTRLCFFKLFSAATEWLSSSQWNLLLDNPKHVWRKTPLNLTKDSHIQQVEQPLESLWVQNPNYKRGIRSNLISLKNYKKHFRVSLYIGVFYLKPNTFK